MMSPSLATVRKATSAKAPRPSTDGTTAYAVAVVDRKVLACQLILAACRRHLDDLERGHRRGLSWDVDEAQRRINFFPDVLTLAEGEFARKPFILQPWLQFIVSSLTGLNGRYGFRRSRTDCADVGKENAKALLAAPSAFGLGTHIIRRGGRAVLGGLRAAGAGASDAVTHSCTVVPFARARTESVSIGKCPPCQ